MQASTDNQLEIVLEPLSRPALGEIRVDGSLFAVGRTEPPFASYDDDIRAALSRRHARLFCEGGKVYLADLESTNGTKVNRARIQQKPCRLNDGDEISFGDVLSYRVRITTRAVERRRSAHGLSLTLTPASDGGELQPIVITRFPFLVGKGDAAFARYRDQHGRQLSYLSRRHAHIFLKDGAAHIEDLNSTNGTFVDGERLQEHALPLRDGALLAFGGEHFAYRVSVQGEAEVDLADAVTRVQGSVSKPADIKAAPSDKTTFVVAPTSFLDIFCIDEQGERAEPGATQPAAIAATQAPARRRTRGGRGAALALEIASAFAGNERDGTRRLVWWKGAALAAVLAAVVLGLWLWGKSERDLKDAVARGEYALATQLADQALAEHPDDAELKALGTEAALKANVPTWLGKLKAGDFDGAKAVLAGLSALGKRNPELQPMVGELEWLGDLQRLVSGRGGADAPIRIYADEDRIGALVERWNTNTGEHQRTLARIASHVPQFGAPYAEALTHLRRLQSDATVYLGAIQRLKASIAAELNRDGPEALEGVLKEYADKYPGIGGLDSVRQDLARYIELRGEARARKSGRLFALLQKAQFQTPPFQEGLRALAASGQLPPAPLVRQYAAATAAWKQGNTTLAMAELQKLTAAGPWAEVAARELERRQAVMAQFAALQASRAASGYVEQLLAFRGTLDADEDVHFARATEADVALQKDNAMLRAQESMNRARALWQEYRNGGAIDARQRIETTVSNPYRARARLLAEANRHALQAMQVIAQVNAPRPAQWSTIRDEIRAEIDLQRSALLDLRNVLDSELLKNKLALLGERSDDGRKSP